MYGINEARNELLTNLMSLTDEEFNSRVESGRWSIAQVTEHLLLMEKGVTTRIQKELSDEESVPSNRKKPIERTLDRSYKVEAPKYLEPGVESYSKKELIQKLSQSREALQRVLSQVEDLEILTQKSAEHPVFGRMDLAQWVEFIGIHELRHLEQIKELKAKL